MAGFNLKGKNVGQCWLYDRVVHWICSLLRFFPQELDIQWKGNLSKNCIKKSSANKTAKAHHKL